MKITFAIIDHKQLQCQCLHLLIEACEDFEVLIKTYGIIEFKQMVANLGYCPKVVLLDLLLYRNNGVAIITWIKENYPGSRIITLGNEAKYYPLYFLFEAGSNAFTRQSGISLWIILAISQTIVSTGILSCRPGFLEI